MRVCHVVLLVEAHTSPQLKFLADSQVWDIVIHFDCIMFAFSMATPVMCQM